MKRHRTPADPNLAETIGRAASPEDDLLPLRLAAEEAGIAEPTLRRYVQQGRVQIFKRQGIQHVTRASMISLRTAGIVRPPGPAVLSFEHVRGETAAECFRRFRANESLVEIVEALKVDPAVVEGLWYKWKHLQKIQLDGMTRCMLEHHGGIECDGLPTAQTGLCGRHAARARILTNEEEATLHAMRTGQEIAKAVCCVSCGQMATRGMCSGCLSKITVAVENGVFVVRAADRQVKVMQLNEIRQMIKGKPSPRGGEQITATPNELATPVDPPAPIDPPTADGPLSPMTENTRALLAEVQARLNK